MPCTDSADRECPELDTIIPDKTNRGYDMKRIIAAVADDGEIFEPHEHWGKNMVVAFIRIMGEPVGVVANNPGFCAGVLNVTASDKAARFIRFCDSFNIPILTFTDVPGYIPGTEQEWAGIIRHGAKLLHAYSEATVPKINVVTRKAYGGGYIGMCSKAVGGDHVMAWPYGGDRRHRGRGGLQHHLPPGDCGGSEIRRPSGWNWPRPMRRNSTIPILPPSLGIVDEIILPRETRKKVIALLDAFRGKVQQRLPKKHNNMPL